MITGRRLVRVLVVAAIGAAAAACVPVTPPARQNSPPNPGPPPPLPLLARSDVVTGLNKPWDIAFVPGATAIAGAMLYTENDVGTVSVYLNSVQPRRVLVTLPGFDPSGEGGAMGIAIDPAYSTNRFVYVCYTTATDNRVTRFTASLDGNGRPASLGSPVAIIAGMAKAGFHNGCRLRFDPSTDGSPSPALFVTMGDAGVGAGPQDDASLSGKVLRVDRDGNAYPGNASGQLWYTKGHRNPQGIAFRPSDNVPYSAEHGTFEDDEINRLTENGGNAGWDPDTGLPPNGPPPSQDYTSSVPMTDPTKFPTAIQATWSSGNPTIALSGIDFLRGAGWRSWEGNIVGAVLKDHELRMFHVDPATGGVIGTRELFDDGATRLRVPVIGPDGALYVATDMSSPTGAIWRFTRN